MRSTIFVLGALLAAGCERPEGQGGDTAAEAKTDKSAAAVPADNTAKNERDQNTAALTPVDQGGSEADRTVTQHIRQGVVDSDGLSITGKNVKIITIDGVVTLRGPVKTAAERSEIAAIAKGVGGVKRVENQLEIAAN